MIEWTALRRDCQIDTQTAGVATPVYVRVTHRPTGLVAEATAWTALSARNLALSELEQRLSVHDEADNGEST